MEMLRGKKTREGSEGCKNIAKGRKTSTLKRIGSLADVELGRLAMNLQRETFCHPATMTATEMRFKYPLVLADTRLASSPRVPKGRFSSLLDYPVVSHRAQFIFVDVAPRRFSIASFKFRGPTDGTSYGECFIHYFSFILGNSNYDYFAVYLFEKFSVDYIIKFNLKINFL